MPTHLTNERRKTKLTCLIGKCDCNVTIVFSGVTDGVGSVIIGLFSVTNAFEHDTDRQSGDTNAFLCLTDEINSLAAAFLRITDVIFNQNQYNYD